MLRKKSSGGTCGPCTVVQWVVMALLFLATLAALVGVYKAHFLSTGATFGTTSGSLALVAFTLSLTLWAKSASHCCGCCCAEKPAAKK